MSLVTPTQSGFFDHLALMCRVIIGLILREMSTRFGRQRLGYGWALIEPSVYILFFVLIRSAIVGRVPFGESILLFFIPGLLVVRVFVGVCGKMLFAISANRALLTYPPVKPVDVMIARFLLESLTMYVILTSFFVLMHWIAGTKVILDYGEFAGSVAALSILCAGFGAFNAVFSILWPTWERIWSFVPMPVMILSGTFFVPKALPSGIQDLLAYNPVLHCVEWLRTSTYLTYDPLLDRSYPILFGYVLLILALSLERLYRPKLLNA